MAKTSLRAYDREIESFIEQNQFEQAIAHAKHILKFYPKHIQTYRLLGKAYLESQRYGDAADVFQRVLSAIPDDFVSHVGMSIIREDEGNLDVAIWHMERAFEIQPANSAIQGELRRLFGRRDGVEPPKVRLTRGALARMYIKGELYQQAIAELRAALAEDPQRPDLLAMLAPAYYLTGQRVEAADTCSTLLKKAPYCLEANRILAEILANTERSSEAQLCRQRVQALDPYAAQISPAAPSPERVPDSAVSLERLVWSPGQPIAGLPGQPEWASSLGLDIGKQPVEGEGEPEWLAGQPAETHAFEQETPSPVSVPPFATVEQTPETVIPPSDEIQIPEWMKTAGWGPSANEGEELPAKLDEAGIRLPDQEEIEGEIEQAKIPEWLQAIAPKQPTTDMEAPEQPGEEILSNESDALSWLQETPPGPSDSVVTWLDEQKPVIPETPPVEIEIEGAGEIPDWLKDLGQVEPATPMEGEAENPDEITRAQDEMNTRELPGWLAAGRQAAEEEQAPQDEIPDWLNPEISQIQAETEPEQPEWMKQASEDRQPADVEAPQAGEPAMEEKPFTASDEDEAFAWLESLAAKQGAEEALLLTPEQRREEPPEWILEASRAEAEKPEPNGFSEEQAAIPDWLQVSEPPVEESPATREAGESSVPEWLSEFESLATEEAEPTPVEDVTAAPEEFEFREFATEIPLEQPESREELAPGAEPGELPDWLREIAETPVEEVETGETGLPAVSVESMETPPPAWIEEPVESTERISEAETSELPDWLQEIAEKPAAEIPSIPEEFATEEVLSIESERAPEEELPSWLMEPEEGVSPATGVSEFAPGEELPSWLMESEEEPRMEMLFGPQVMAGSEAPPVDESSVPISDTQPTRVPPSTPVEEPIAIEAALPATAPLSHEVPDWVKDLDREEALSESTELPSAETAGVPTDDEAAFAWLEGLAARMGTDEALLLTPEERTEEPPEWVIRAAEEATELPVEGLELQEAAPVEAAVFEEFAAEGWGEALSEEPITEQPVEQEAIPEPGESIPLEELHAEILLEQQAPLEEEWLPVQSELPTPVEELPEEIELPAPEQPFESMTMVEEVLGIQAEPIQEIEELPETYEPEAGLRQEEVPSSIEQELPPELPPWLADVDKTELSQEEEGWLPPEEAHLDAGVAPGPDIESLLSKESIEPVEAEGEQLDVNKAGLAELERLPGVGFIRAQSVLAYLQEYGPLSNLDELVNVPGFDSSLVESLRGQLTTGEGLPVEQIPEGMDVHQMALIQARNALAQGESNQALTHYVSLIKSKQLLPEVIQDLNEALYRFPVDVSIWEALGDAHMRSGRLQDALDAYTKAEELIR